MIKPFKEFENEVSYAEYIAEKIDKSIDYSEYIAEQLNNKYYGPQGWSGYSGFNGPQGFSGITGSSGATGYSGNIYSGSTYGFQGPNNRETLGPQCSAKQLPVMLEDFHIKDNNVKSSLEDFFPTLQ